MFRGMRYVMQIGNYTSYGLHNKDTLFKLYMNGKEEGIYKLDEIMDKFYNNPEYNVKSYHLDELYRNVYITTK